jgi:hypothetical protein
VLLNPGNELARNNLKWAREEKARRVVHSTH